MKVVWSDPALDDVETHTEYLDQFNRVAAADLANALLTAGDSLASLPRRGRPGRLSGTRELLVIFPYVIVYQIHAERVEILRVWHGKLLK